MSGKDSCTGQQDGRFCNNPLVRIAPLPKWYRHICGGICVIRGVVVGTFVLGKGNYLGLT